jgi:hypothetical protein
MNKIVLSLSLLLAPLAVQAAVSVEWVKPESFKDPYYFSTKSEKSRQITLDAMQEFIVKEATPMLRPGYDLKLQVTQLDLSGEFEPWSDHPDTRIIKAPYFGYIAFDYVLTDDKGAEVKKGTAKLVNEQLTPLEHRDRDELDPFLCTTIRQWLHSNLPVKK